MTMTRNYEYPVTETVLSVEQFDEGWMPTNLSQAVGWLASKLEEVPPDYRESATIEIDTDSYYDSTYATVVIRYRRPATQAEINGRKLDDARRHQMAVRRHHAEIEAAQKRLAELGVGTIEPTEDSADAG